MGTYVSLTVSIGLAFLAPTGSVLLVCRDVFRVRTKDIESYLAIGEKSGAISLALLRLAEIVEYGRGMVVAQVFNEVVGFCRRCVMGIGA